MKSRIELEIEEEERRLEREERIRKLKGEEKFEQAKTLLEGSLSEKPFEPKKMIPRRFMGFDKKTYMRIKNIADREKRGEDVRKPAGHGKKKRMKTWKKSKRKNKLKNRLHRTGSLSTSRS